MFKEMIWRFGSSLIAAALTATAASIALVAAAFGLYAALGMVMTRAAAAGLTALTFAVIAGLIILAAPRLIARGPKGRRQAKDRRKGEAARTAMEVGLAALTVAADLAMKRRPGKGEKTRHEKPGKPPARPRRFSKSV
jgi:hypothetical protein